MALSTPRRAAVDRCLISPHRKPEEGAMICLAIDCAFPDAVIALSDGERILMRQFGPQRSHALSIIAELERLLAEANVKAEQLDRIGVGQGPGSFTGLA